MPAQHDFSTINCQRFHCYRITFRKTNLVDEDYFKEIEKFAYFNEPCEHKVSDTGKAIVPAGASGLK
jgi:hypothetical protein